MQAKEESESCLWVSTSLEVASSPNRTHLSITDARPKPPDQHEASNSTEYRAEVQQADVALTPALITQLPLQECFGGEDGTVFYRLTPRVWGWIVKAMRSAEKAHGSGKLSTEQFADTRKRFQTLSEWVANRYPADELAREIANPQPLPKASTEPSPSVRGARPTAAAGQSDGRRTAAAAAAAAAIDAALAAYRFPAGAGGSFGDVRMVAAYRIGDVTAAMEVGRMEAFVAWAKEHNAVAKEAWAKNKHNTAKEIP